jgi:hypothetical protein
VKLENFKSKQNHDQEDFYGENEGPTGQYDDDFEALYGVDNEFTKELKDKINKSKREKGRGLLLSFYEFNQERRIPRLIRAMKMGL